MISSNCGCSRPLRTNSAWESKTHCPGSSSGHAEETPIRLIRRQNKHAHANFLAAVEPDALERQTDLRLVPPVRDLAGAVPHEIGGPLLSGRRAVERVHLDPARVDHQVVGRLPGPERVEAAHPIVPEHVVPSADRRPDLFGLVVVAPKSKVQVTIVMGDPHVRPPGHGFASNRIVRLPRRRCERITLPYTVVQKPVDFRGDTVGAAGFENGPRHFLSRTIERRVE